MTGDGRLPAVVLLANTPIGSVLLWVGVLIVFVLLGALVIFALRRSVLGERPGSGDDAGMLEQMRRMVERGEMSQDEYDRTRRAIVEKAQGRATRHPPSDPG